MNPPVRPTTSALHPVPARLGTTGLLGRWQARNAAATLPHCIDQLDAHGNLANLRRVTGDHEGAFAGMWFADSDVYKTLEAAAWAGGFDEFVADTVALLEKAQDPDGYLNSYYQTDHRDKQWAELGFSHEMYCAGHLIQAAVAAGPAAPIFAVARRFADLLVRRYGPDGEQAVCGHPEIETALVELYRGTGHRPYLDLAAAFVARRGHGLLGDDGRFGPRYFLDHRPVRDADEVTGHVVRQVYLLAGAVDVAVETGDAELLAATERLWESAQAGRTYLTGGQGSRHRDEAFGDPYELPPDRAYAETCAAIGSFQWAWRLLLATGRSRYAEEMERLLYNGIAGSTAVDGTAFFYSNPLQLRTGHDGSHEDAPSQRLPWYSCACCPPNLARLLASLHAYLATADPSGLQIHLYADATITHHDRTVTVATRYPWDEQVTVTVVDSGPGPWTLSLRVPAWCADARLSVNGSLIRAGHQAGYLRVTRTWLPGDRVSLVLAMPPRLVTAHPRVDAVRGTAAVMRGPLVYCLEHADMPAAPVFEDFALDPAVPIRIATHEAGLAPVTLRASVVARTSGEALYGPVTVGAASRATVTAIPYFLWANRAPGPMRVWIPLASREEPAPPSTP